MPDVVGLRFKKCSKIYNFEINGIDVKKNDLVVVESNIGLTIGTIIIEKHYVEESVREFKKILRIATEEDLNMKLENRELEKDAYQFCFERIHTRKLPMKLVQTEVSLDKKRIIFYFTADGRIDFRELVKDLASRFKTRIEMRQIGVRDETKLIGGIGICGREVCCNSFLSYFAPISIKMAKEQELILNTGKLSGLCGRLMCCLGYESSLDIDLTSSIAKPSKDISLIDSKEYPIQKEQTPREVDNAVIPTAKSEMSTYCQSICQGICSQEEETGSNNEEIGDSSLERETKNKNVPDTYIQKRQEDIRMEKPSSENKTSTSDDAAKEKKKKKSRFKRTKKKRRK